jgi:hypothetical protein
MSKVTTGKSLEFTDYALVFEGEHDHILPTFMVVEFDDGSLELSAFERTDDWIYPCHAVSRETLDGFFHKTLSEDSKNFIKKAALKLLEISEL